MSIVKILLVLAVGGAVYAMCDAKTQKKIKRTVKHAGNSIQEFGEDAIEKISEKMEKEKAHHA